MWVAKFKITHEDWILQKTLKYNLTASGIPLNSYKKNGKQYHNGMVFLNGNPKDKEKFIKSLKKDPRIKKSKAIGSQVYVLIEADDHIAPLMPETVFFTRPVFFKEGYEYWELGAWDKKPLKEFYNKAKKVADVNILKLQEENPSVFVQHSIPKLTEKQKNAIELAIEFGYYNYPRDVSVEELAKKANVPRTTFQEHLRKAESKLMEILIQSI